MSSTLFAPPRSREFTSAGTVLGGAKLYFYVTGTTTPAQTYTNVGLTAAHTHPVVADTGGLFPAIWLSSLVTYDVTLKNSAGATQWTVTAYSDALLGSEVGLVLYPRTTDEISAAVTPTAYQYPPFMPDRYGGDHTGTTDSSAAFHTAITVANGKPIILYRGGTYRTDVLASTNITKSVEIIGNGATLNGNSTTTSGFVFSNPGATIAHIRISDVHFTSIYTFVVNCDQGSTAPAAGLEKTVTEFVFKDNTITAGYSGVQMRCRVGTSICTGNKISGLASSTIRVYGFLVGGNHYDVGTEQALVKNAVFADNVIDDLDCTLGSSPECHGIIFYGESYTITGNVVRNIRNSSAGTGAEGIYVKARWGTISNNTLRDAGTQEGSIVVKGRARDGAAGESFFGYSTLVSGNSLYSSAGLYYGVYIQCSDCLVTGNSFEGFGGHAIYTVRDVSNNNVAITNNLISQHRGVSAIHAREFIGDGLVISGNTINQLLASQGTIADTYGIYVLAPDTTVPGSTLTSVDISDNRIIHSDTMSATAATTSVRGIVIVTTETNLSKLRVANNFVSIVSAVDDRGISFSGSDTIDNVTITGNDCLNTDKGLTVSMTFTDAFIENNVFSVDKDGLANVEVEHCNATIYNTSSGGTATSQLPASIVGLSYTFLKTVNQIFRVDPDGTEIIRGGGAGKYLQMDAAATPALVKVRCFVSGTWDVVNAYGTITYEP